MPEPILVGRNEHKLKSLADAHGVKPLDHRPRRAPSATAATQSTSTPRPPIAARPRCARPSPPASTIYCEKPIADDLRGRPCASAAGAQGRRQERRGAGQALAARPAQAQVPHRHRLLRPHPLRARRVRLLGLQGDTSPRSGRAGTTARRTAAASSSTCSATGATSSTTSSATSRRCRASARPTSPSASTRAGKPYHCTADDAAYATFELDNGIICQFNSSWCVRVRRDDLLTSRWTAQGSAVAGLRECWVQHDAATPKPVWNPDIDSPIDFYDGWTKVPDAADLRQRLQGPVGAVPAARGAGRARSAGTCWKAPRACSSPSSASRAGPSAAGSTCRRSNRPAGRGLLLLSLSSCSGTPAESSGRGAPTPRAPPAARPARQREC